MRRLVTGMCCATLLLALTPSAGAKTQRLELSMSNFRFCEGATCSPLDIGYLRTDMGPAGLDNPQAAVDVKRGAIVSWVYRDTTCDSFGCPGHNVIFENGTVQGAKKGFVPAGKGEKKITAKITQKAGTTIRYFCSVNNHYQEGMTGILNVVK